MVSKNRQEKKSLSQNALLKWASSTLNAKPTVDGKDSKIEFSFKAGGQYPLECLVLAQESIAMLTVTGFAYLAIKSDKVDDVLKYCTKESSVAGVFSIANGALVYIHSRSVERDLDGIELINSMISTMDEAVSSVAEGVLEILKS